MRQFKLIGLLAIALCASAYASVEQSDMDWIAQFHLDVKTREATINWVIEKDRCIAKEKQSKALLPRSDWFDSLPKEEKIKVILYINKAKLQACAEKESLQLERLVNEGGHEKLKEVLSVLGAFDWPDENELEGIDKDKVNQLSKQVEMFNLSVIAEQLNLIE